MRWVVRSPEPLHDGVSVEDATTAQLEFLEEEKARCLRTAVWTRATRHSYVSNVFLVPKPQANKRLVLDFRWLNTYCVCFKCTMETLKKLRRVVRENHYMFSFDLKDGHHVIKIRLPEVHAVGPEGRLDAVCGTARRVERLSSDLRAGDAGGGGMNWGPISLETPDGAAEVAGQSTALHGRLRGALRQ
ncbi:hypothetical protein CYMTET_20413 [Cymbomonas tetramitiformis]|uniref:Reverse transcriptase n=1 Tax=Cymbomonas tetramitiformis TaxID=36881 RepID=A0AAE0G466_9CHLO|nr:hypothetical protein CYMTET_20413 [Cymbomonas tetramitiformis]